MNASVKAAPDISADPVFNKPLARAFITYAESRALACADEMGELYERVPQPLSPTIVSTADVSPTANGATA